MKTFTVIESMTKFTDQHGRIVRVWRNEEYFREDYPETSYLIGKVLGAIPSELWSKRRIIEALTDIDGVSTVEVVDKTGCGIIVHSE